MIGPGQEGGARRAPLATYRLQLHGGFRLPEAEALVEYLDALGVSDLYLSPIQMARPGSAHGYDVVDHSRLNPELGSEEDLLRLGERLRARGMGIVLDVVPNHMCIAGPWNAWWNDVLENGPGSPFAARFDIDWSPPKTDLEAKVLLPVLGTPFGRALEAQEITVEYAEGAFLIRYYELRLAAAPRSQARLLQAVLDRVRAGPGPAEAVQELESILTALRHLPLRTETRPEQVRERQREKQVARRRLRALCDAEPAVREALAATLEATNGAPGDPRSFDELEAFLEDQGFRLAFWRVAADEINYRRFFDINELAAIRIEDPDVFRAVHELPLRLARRGIVSGLRVDHIDGLRDPEGYIDDLTRALAAALGQAPDGGARGYLWVEKILGASEALPATWSVHGTTGYEALRALGGIAIAPEGARRLEELFARLVGARRAFADVAYEGKKLILEVSMSSELTVLSRVLDRLSEQHRATRDFTLNGLHSALAEVIACFPVYRTYVRPESDAPGAADRRAIEAAIREAKRRNPATSASIFDFIASVLLLEVPPGLSADERARRREFALRFQQLTSPVMAKGVEDTSFYRHFPLAGVNEVGGEPAHPTVSVAELHAFNAARRDALPHGLSATSTHDTKRSEDVRARLAVLSELAAEWELAVARWRELNAPHRREGPDAVEEYLIYQTLVGAWPAGGLAAEPGFSGRIAGYMLKALREAKVHTSWVSPNEAYEREVAQFTETLLDQARSARFLEELAGFVARVELPGFCNSLAQVVLKVAGPGIPDFYQGSELWDLSLTDPDNRRPVDFARRRAALAALQAADGEEQAARAERLLRSPGDGRVKLLVTSRALALRRARREAFERGAYVPLEVTSATGLAEHVVAFARVHGDAAVVAIVGRLMARMASPPVGPPAWGDASVVLPEGARAARCEEALTGAGVPVRGGRVRVAEALARLPVALLDLRFDR